MKRISVGIVLLCCAFQTLWGQSSEAIFQHLDLTGEDLQKVNQELTKGNKTKALSQLLKHYRQKENLYIRVSKKEAAELIKNYPDEVREIIKVADEVKEQVFLFRYEWDMEKTNVPFRFENTIDWLKIINSDDEWCWMLNRHRYWQALGQAYLLTGEESYVKTFVEQLTDWVQKNPAGDPKLKWGSWRRIEAGIRCENWIKTFELVKDSPHITESFLALFLNSLREHAEFINNSFNAHSKTSNWGVLEYHGLFNVALFMPEFKDAKKWQHDALQKLTTCIDLQILDDGTQWEQSPMYHNEVFHCFMNLELLAQRKGMELPKLIQEKTKAMAHANIEWQKPNYHQPLFGDSDDSDLRTLLATASVVFENPVLRARAASKMDLENIFVFGQEKAAIYNKQKGKLPDFLSAYHKSSGDLYMRSSWDENAYYASFHMRKLGCGHGHDDLLHLSLFAHGRDYLTDQGRYTYVENEWREFFKSSQNHNTLAVDNEPNTIYATSWSNSFEARSEGVYVHSTPKFDYAESQNTAYKRLSDPVQAKRRMLYLKPNIWILFDHFSANKSHTYTQYFNFPNEKIAVGENEINTTYSNQNLKIQAVKPVKSELSDSWYSPEYNLKTPAKKVSFSRENTGDDSFITLLYFPEETELTYTKEQVGYRSGKPLSEKDAEAITIHLTDYEYTLLVVHNSPAPAANFFTVNEHILRGEVVLIEKNKSSKEEKIYILKE